MLSLLYVIICNIMILFLEFDKQQLFPCVSFCIIFKDEIFREYDSSFTSSLRFVAIVEPDTSTTRIWREVVEWSRETYLTLRHHFYFIVIKYLNLPNG